MAVGDQLGRETVELINKLTIPELEASLHGLLNRLQGLKIVITVEIPSEVRRDIKDLE